MITAVRTCTLLDKGILSILKPSMSMSALHWAEQRAFLFLPCKRRNLGESQASTVALLWLSYLNLSLKIALGLRFVVATNSLHLGRWLIKCLPQSNITGRQKSGCFSLSLVVLILLSYNYIFLQFPKTILLLSKISDLNIAMALSYAWRLSCTTLGHSHPQPLLAFFQARCFLNNFLVWISAWCVIGCLSAGSIFIFTCFCPCHHGMLRLSCSLRSIGLLVCYTAEPVEREFNLFAIFGDGGRYIGLLWCSESGDACVA